MSTVRPSGSVGRSFWTISRIGGWVSGEPSVTVAENSARGLQSLSALLLIAGGKLSLPGGARRSPRRHQLAPLHARSTLGRSQGQGRLGCSRRPKLAGLIEAHGAGFGAPDQSRPPKGVGSASGGRAPTLFGIGYHTRAHWAPVENVASSCAARNGLGGGSPVTSEGLPGCVAILPGCVAGTPPGRAGAGSPVRPRSGAADSRGCRCAGRSGGAPRARPAGPPRLRR